MSGYPFFIWALPYGGARFSLSSLYPQPAHKERRIQSFADTLADQLAHTGEFYRKAAVEADGPEGEAIRRCCMQNRIRAVVGFSERDGGSLFMSQWICGPDGSMTVRRKLRPTSVERILYGDGDVSLFSLSFSLATLLTNLCASFQSRAPISEYTKPKSATWECCSVGYVLSESILELL